MRVRLHVYVRVCVWVFVRESTETNHGHTSTRDVSLEDVGDDEVEGTLGKEDSYEESDRK